MASPHDIADELRGLIAEFRELVSEARGIQGDLIKERRAVEKLIATDLPKRVDHAFGEEVNKRLREIYDHCVETIRRNDAMLTRRMEDMAMEINGAAIVALKDAQGAGHKLVTLRIGHPGEEGIDL